VELRNEFEVSSPVGEAWECLTDIERIAPCMPGARLTEVDGEEFHGVVKVKLGAISAEYRGTARFVEKDDAARRAVLRAEGREARGQGNATATITAEVVPSASGAKVSVSTDLQITGRLAQFGRGVLAEVSSRLLSQFVENLETTVLHAARSGPDGEGEGSPGEGGDTAPEAAPPGPGPGGPRDGHAPSDDALDIFSLAGRPIARRAAPVLLAAGVVACVVLLARRAARSGWSSRR
jgi:carbon monoxide dehydrogenase subunit G